MVIYFVLGQSVNTECDKGKIYISFFSFKIIKGL